MEPDWSYHCAAFAVERAGVEVWDKLGGCPAGPAEAAALYRRLGARNLGDAVAAVLPEIPPLQAMRGDLVMVDGALGVCRGELAEFMDAMQPMSRATRAWRAKG